MASAARQSALLVTVDPHSPVPPFEQLRTAIRQLIVTGAMPIGARLPTVRQLAADLGLAPGTVARAFRELEAEGIIESRRRHGTHIKAMPAPPDGAERKRRIREAATSYAAAVAELGIDSDDAIALVREALAG
jgi:DNA-binding transcriptional regulator YhcF (GntR family)